MPIYKTGTSPAYLDHQSLLALLYENQESEVLWQQLQANHNGELLVLITSFHCNFYHPYLPMTESKREELISCLQAEWLKNSAIDLHHRHRIGHSASH